MVPDGTSKGVFGRENGAEGGHFFKLKYLLFLPFFGVLSFERYYFQAILAIDDITVMEIGKWL